MLNGGRWPAHIVSCSSWDRRCLWHAARRVSSFIFLFRGSGSVNVMYGRRKVTTGQKSEVRSVPFAPSRSVLTSAHSRHVHNGRIRPLTCCCVAVCPRMRSQDVARGRKQQRAVTHSLLCVSVWLGVWSAGWLACTPSFDGHELSRGGSNHPRCVCYGFSGSCWDLGMDIASILCHGKGPHASQSSLPHLLLYTLTMHIHNHSHGS